MVFHTRSKIRTIGKLIKEIPFRIMTQSARYVNKSWVKLGGSDIKIYV